MTLNAVLNEPPPSPGNLTATGNNTWATMYTIDVSKKKTKNQPCAPHSTELEMIPFHPFFVSQAPVQKEVLRVCDC